MTRRDRIIGAAGCLALLTTARASASWWGLPVGHGWSQEG